MKKVLVANRGEIALRVFRSCRKLDLKTVAIYSTADRELAHVSAADEAFCVGGEKANESYLNISAILEIAKNCGADAIHPGYGFLAENSEFAAAVEAAGITFIGPTVSSMRLLGDKDEARKLAASAGAPLIPGYHGEKQDLKSLQVEAKKLGFPLMIKAAAGGGGKGIRRAEAERDLVAALEAAKREALAFFLDDTLILEKIIAPARHIEVQLIGDRHGNLLHVFERECSLQRRRQKVIEETPAPNLSPKLRDKILDAALAIGKAAKLTNATTVEFLMQPSAKDFSTGDFYFLEANCRIQVEHPVTEMVCGVDLVELQLLSAMGEVFKLKQKDIQQKGASIQARVYAESPAQEFIPRIGTISKVRFPEQHSALRLEHALAAGTKVTTFYDPMLAKIIVWGDDRKKALKNLTAALAQSAIFGVENNISFLKSLSQHPRVIEGKVDINFIEADLAKILPVAARTENEAQIALCAYFASSWSAYLLMQANNPFFIGSKISSKTILTENIALTLPNRNYSMHCVEEDKRINQSACVLSLNLKKGKPESLEALIGEKKLKITCLTSDVTNSVQQISVGTETHTFETALSSSKRLESISGLIFVGHRSFRVQSLALGETVNSVSDDQTKLIKSPLPGRVIELKAKAGAVVKTGDVLVIIESMKMEHAIRAPRDTKVEAVLTSTGASVSQGQGLVQLD